MVDGLGIRPTGLPEKSNSLPLRKGEEYEVLPRHFFMKSPF